MLILSIFLMILSTCQSRQCTVTDKITLFECQQYCWQTYNGKKDFYHFQSGNCLETVICGKGYYLDQQKNICVDQFGGYILKQMGWVVKTKHQNIRFVRIVVFKGYLSGPKVVCEQGWKSSMKTFQKSNISTLVYLCDEEIKDGQIYPKTHGQYFLQKLTLGQQVYAMHRELEFTPQLLKNIKYQCNQFNQKNSLFFKQTTFSNLNSLKIDQTLGQDSYEQFFSIKACALFIFSCIYTLFNLIAFCLALSRKMRICKCFCFGKKYLDNKKLTQSQKKQIQLFFQKRKNQNQKLSKQIKSFSFQGEINKQSQLLKAIKLERQEFLNNKIKQKQKQKLKIKNAKGKQVIEQQQKLKQNKNRKT